MARSRPVSKFKSYTNKALRDWAQQIYNKMTVSALFTTPPNPYADFQTAIDQFTVNIDLWGVPGNRGSREDHSNMVNSRKQIQDFIRAYIGYVASLCNGDQAIIESAGMVANTPGVPHGILAAPQYLHSPYSKHTRAGEYRLRWKKVKGAVSYNLYVNTTSDPTTATMVMEPTKTLAVYSSLSHPSGTQLYFWCAGVNTDGIGVMSDVCMVRSL